jgi:hypothetical protein
VELEQAAKRTAKRHREFVRARMKVTYDAARVRQVTEQAIRKVVQAKDNPADLINVAAERVRPAEGRGEGGFAGKFKRRLELLADIDALGPTEAWLEGIPPGKIAPPRPGWRSCNPSSRPTCPSVPAVLAAWLHQLTCLTSARFRARAPGPVSGQSCSAPGGEPGMTALVSCCLSAAGIGFLGILSRLGIPPLLRLGAGMKSRTELDDRGGYST